MNKCFSTLIKAYSESAPATEAPVEEVKFEEPKNDENLAESLEEPPADKPVPEPSPMENEKPPELEIPDEPEKIEFNFSERLTKVRMHFGDLKDQAREYAFTLAQEVFGDKADKAISDKIADHAVDEGGDDEGKVMGIIKNSYCSH